MRGRLKAILPDTAVLRHGHDFRMLFLSGVVSLLGSMTTMVALPFQVAHLTGSFVSVGLLGLFELVPLVVFGLWGGALADALDRRRLILLTEIAQAGLSGLLLINAALPHPAVWPIFGVAMLFAAADGLQRPSLDAIVPRLVSGPDLPGAIALGSLKWQLGAIVGPSLGGLLIATAGPASAYAFDLLTFLVSALFLVRINPVPPVASAEQPSWRTIAAGLHYARTRRDLLGTYLVDLAAMVFAYPTSLFPFLVIELHAPWSLGLLYAATSVGSLIATATSGWSRRTHHYGRAVVVAAFCWGIAIAGVGLVHSVLPTLLFLVAAGAADMVSGLFRGLIWNRSIPDDMRGRLAGVELLSYSVGPQLGQVRASGMASLTSLRTSIALGGIACAFSCVALAFSLPTLWAFDDRTDENVRRNAAQDGAIE
jgi:MFS family permease